MIWALYVQYEAMVDTLTCFAHLIVRLIPQSGHVGICPPSLNFSPTTTHFGVSATPIKILHQFSSPIIQASTLFLNFSSTLSLCLCNLRPFERAPFLKCTVLRLSTSKIASLRFPPAVSDNSEVCELPRLCWLCGCAWECRK
jgi:hypothetical protein